MWHVVTSGSVEAVRCLFDLGTVVLTYSPEIRKAKCELCKENRLVVEDYNKRDYRNPCMRAIGDNKLEIVKLLDEQGSHCCKSFKALRHDVLFGRIDVVSYLLNKYKCPLNIEYINVESGRILYKN